MQPNGTETRPSSPLDEGLHEAVARTARARPDAVAVIDGGHRTTYAELDRTADAWAAALTRHTHPTAGTAPGAPVPILLPRGLPLVTALLAVLKTGVAYALLDPSWPVPRLREVLEQLDATVLIAGEDAREWAEVPVWTPAGAPADPPADFQPVAVPGAAPCCVFFTSGTTGRAKGVLSPHHATARLFTPGSFADFTPGIVVPLAAPVPWDAFSLELWSALLSGGTSLIVEEPYLSAPALRAAITRHGATTAWLTSSLFNMIVDEDPAAFHGLRQLMIGGERLSPAHVSRFLRRHPQILLLNGYGPVESTVFATTHAITAADCARPGGIPVGRAVPGTEVHVLAGDRVCAVDEVGEICISGSGLALRYLGDPALTAAKFTTIRAGGRPLRVYRTGDLGRWDADGLLHYHGRADRQLKIRGHRIEPAEVERRIEELLPVRACRVVRRDDPAGPQLVAFCVPRQAGDTLPGADATLRAALPGYQVPAAVIPVAAFPVTAQGKLDERALLSRHTPAAALPPAALPPGAPIADPTARVVAEVFADVLGRASIPVDVPFADLGGTSLGAGRVCARLAARLDRAVPLSQLYEHPTVTSLAAWLDAATPTAGPAPAGPPGDVPLSPMQLVYLTRHLTEPGDLTAHCLLTWTVEGELDQAALRRAVAAVHQRHEPLRARYSVDPRPAARVVDVEPPPLEVLEAQASTEAAVAALRALFAAELLPDEADVWRVAIAPAGAVTVLACVVHHIAFDGWSEAVLARDLGDAYRAALRGPVPPVRPAASLAALHRHRSARLDRADLDRRRAEAHAELAGAPALTWPAGITSLRPGAPGLVRETLTAPAVSAVNARAAAAGVSPFVVLLAHYAAALADVTGQRDVVLGVPAAQRDLPGVEDALGCHLTMLAVRLREDALTDAAAGVRATGLAYRRALAAQDVPLPELLRLAGPPGPGRPPLFQTLFALQDNAAPKLDLGGPRTSFVRQPYLDLPLELHTELWPQDDGTLLLTVYHRRDVVPDAAARDLAKRFAYRLHAASGGAS